LSSTRRKMLAAREDIANRIVELATRKDMTVYQTVNDILEQALRVEELGLTMSQVVDERWMLERAKETGFTFAIEHLQYLVVDAAFEENKKKISDIWGEMGTWYGKYFKSKFDDPLQAFRETLDLLTTGTSEYSYVNSENELTISCIGERYTEGYTEVFSVFIENTLKVLGYKLNNKEVSKGIIKLHLRR